MRVRKNTVSINEVAQQVAQSAEKAKYWLNFYAVIDGKKIQVMKGLVMDSLEVKGGEPGSRTWLEGQLACLRDQVKPGERKTITGLEIKAEIYAVPEAGTENVELMLGLE